MQQATMEIIPQELILDILLRLPVKSVVRFKCVSKSWLSLITDPHFGKSHFQRSSQHPQRILLRADLNMQSIDINACLHDDSSASKLYFPLSKTPLHNLEIMGSFRGFLLLKIENLEKQLFLWNPSTGDCKPIPLRLPSNKVLLYGFCYDESTDDYLVVHDLNPSGRFVVFSVRTNSRKTLAVNFRLISGASFTRVGWTLNGAIHWLIWRPRGASRIVAFDIARKNLRQVPTPDGVLLEFCDLGVLGGCLALTQKKTAEVKIWVMRDYGVKASWTKLISMTRYGKDIRHMSYILPLCFTKDGQLVAVDGHIRLSKWSEQGEMLELGQYYHNQNSFWGSAIAYTETLLPLP